jgi:long-subunit fatty acid transport protein
MTTPRARARPAALLAPAAAAAIAATLLAPAAAAAELSLFQRGGRGVAQAGALVARADDPSAATYNPAGLAALDEGFAVAAGVVAVDPRDEYSERFQFESRFGPPPPDFVGRSRSSPSIDALPVLHLAWRDPARLGRWAFGLGVDTPYRRTIDWREPVDSVVFSDRFRRIELTQLHALAAVRLTPEWSVGAGVRYLDGDFDTGLERSVGVIDGAGQFLSVPVNVDAAADVDGVGFDLGLRFARADWGAGAVLRSGVTVEGEVSPRFDAARPSDPVAAAELDERLRILGAPWERRLELPGEVAVGAWFRPLPRVRAELDVVRTLWSDYREIADPGGFTAAPPQSLFAGWDDTTSVRLGLEAELTHSFTLGLGAAREPSPVPSRLGDPGVFPGDTRVLALGGSLRRGRLVIDLGLSRHDSDVAAQRAHPRFGLRDSRFESEAWVGGVTVRTGWR